LGWLLAFPRVGGKVKELPGEKSRTLWELAKKKGKK